MSLTPPRRNLKKEASPQKIVMGGIDHHKRSSYNWCHSYHGSRLRLSREKLVTCVVKKPRIKQETYFQFLIEYQVWSLSAPPGSSQKRNQYKKRNVCTNQHKRSTKKWNTSCHENLFGRLVTYIVTNPALFRMRLSAIEKKDNSVVSLTLRSSQLYRI